MRIEVPGVVETLPYPCVFKVHKLMCTELMKIVDRLSKIFPEIEADRPCSSSGMQALCSVSSAIETAKQLLQHCRESSKLYSSMLGDLIVWRFQRSRSLLEQSLGQIKSMVSDVVAEEISRMIDDLRGASLIPDSSVLEAGKVVRELLQQYAYASDSMEDTERKALQLAASRLQITSPKALIIEKRSIKTLLDKVGDTDPKKKKVLRYLLYLLQKYGNLIMGGQTENACAQHEGTIAFSNFSDRSIYYRSVEVESPIGYGQYERQTDVVSIAIPPEEFKCPMCFKLMYDPVIIPSGQTFERICIQKWFNEGNDTCPITKMKLCFLSLTPNINMKDLISKWCMKHGVTLVEPSKQPEVLRSVETYATSIGSFKSSMTDQSLQMDLFNMSLGSLHSVYSSDSSYSNVTDDLSLKSMQTDDDCRRCESYSYIHEMDLQFLAKLVELEWKSQCKVVEDVKNHLQYYDQACHFITFENFVQPIIIFLTDACDLHDLKAQRTGSELLLAFLSKSRSVIPYLREDAFSLLASLLESEVTEEALAIMKVLSGHWSCGSKIAASGALTSILKILDSQIRDFQEKAIEILYNVSSNSDVHSCIVSLECIPKLVPYLDDRRLAGNCILILKNLCNIDESRVSVAETNGCIASVAQLLEIGSCKDQEHAVAVLLSLCSQSVQYCKLVMDEGVIPNLVNIAINGNDKGKVSALELLRILRDIKYDDEGECTESDFDTSRDSSNQSKEKKSSSKLSIFGKMFSKPSAFSPKKKKLDLQLLF